jgi:hypothetical protein
MRGRTGGVRLPVGPLACVKASIDEIAAKLHAQTQTLTIDLRRAQEAAASVVRRRVVLAHAWCFGRRRWQEVVRFFAPVGRQRLISIGDQIYDALGMNPSCVGGGKRAKG